MYREGRRNDLRRNAQEPGLLGKVDLPAEVQCDVGDVRPLVAVDVPTFAEQIVDLLGTVRRLRQSEDRHVRVLDSVGRLAHDQVLVQIFVGQRAVRKCRAARPELPESDGERVDVRTVNGSVLQRGRANRRHERAEMTYGQRFGRDPSQRDLVPVAAYPVLFLVLWQGDGTIGEFDRVVGIEETVSRGDIVVRDLHAVEILKCVGKLMGEVDVLSRTHGNVHGR